MQAALLDVVSYAFLLLLVQFINLLCIEMFACLQCLSTFRRYFAMLAACLVHQQEIFLEDLRWSRYVATEVVMLFDNRC